MASPTTDPIMTAAISAVTSLVTTLVTTYVKARIEKRQKADDSETQKLVDRVNPDLNIVREYEERRTQFGMHTSRKWYVNPFWISYENGDAVLRGWNGFKVIEIEYGPADKHGDPTSVANVPLKPERLERAKERFEWLVLYEDGSNCLRHHSYAPIDAEHRHLFQPLPEPKRKLFKRSASGK